MLFVLLFILLYVENFTSVPLIIFFLILKYALKNNKKVK